MKVEIEAQDLHQLMASKNELMKDLIEISSFVNESLKINFDGIKTKRDEDLDFFIETLKVMSESSQRTIRKIADRHA
jgi:hypothetical protein